MPVDCAEVRALAERYCYGYDGEAMAAGARAREGGHFTRYDFLTVCAWKTGRSKSKVEVNDETTIHQATARALADHDERDRMEALLELNGVGIPTASALLCCAHPREYPILDVNALKALAYESQRTTYSVTFWLGYLEACRRFAAACQVDLRTLDKALWQYTREQDRRLA
jgi:hypothetical protein